jgi:hypothetical protein
VTIPASTPLPVVYQARISYAFAANQAGLESGRVGHLLLDTVLLVLLLAVSSSCFRTHSAIIGVGGGQHEFFSAEKSGPRMVEFRLCLEF